MDAWDTYCAIEKAMFEAGSAYVREIGLSGDDLEAVLAEVEETITDVEPLVLMLLGRKDVPEGWNVNY